MSEKKTKARKKEEKLTPEQIEQAKKQIQEHNEKRQKDLNSAKEEFQEAVKSIGEKYKVVIAALLPVEQLPELMKAQIKNPGLKAFQIDINITLKE